MIGFGRRPDGVSPQTAEEQSLVERCRRGDQRAWAEFYRGYAPGIETFVRGVLGQHVDVDDIVQRVFLESLSALGRFRGDSSLRTWLHKIATHVVRKHARSRWRHRRKVDAYAEELRPSSPDVSMQAEARQQLRVVSEALSELPVDFRMVWVMIEVQGMSAADVAQAVGTKPATIRTRHFRAKAKLMEALRERAPADADPASTTSQPAPNARARTAEAVR